MYPCFVHCVMINHFPKLRTWEEEVTGASLADKDSCWHQRTQRQTRHGIYHEITERSVWFGSDGLSSITADIKDPKIDQNGKWDESQTSGRKKCNINFQ